MTTLASLSEDRLTVEPGLSVDLDVTVRNDGTVVDAFRVLPVGIPQQWVSSEPAELSLFPAASGTVRVTISPPRVPEVEPGERPFALRVESSQVPDGSVVEEGVLDISPFAASVAELQPRTSHARGRRPGRHTLAVDNRGNVPLEVAVTGADRDGLLRVAVDPPVLVVEPGEARLVQVRPAARRGFWRGPDRTVPFTVTVQPPDAVPLLADGTFLHRARIPSWLPKLLAALLALGVLAALLWQGVLKPAVEDEARAAAQEATAEELAPIQAQLAEQSAALDDVQAAVAAGGGSGAPPASPGPSFVDPALGDPRVARLDLEPGRQETSTDFGEDVFSLTDVVLSNPKGHAGVLTVRRGSEVLLRSELANFRDLDYHFVSPIVFRPGQPLRAEVTCTDPGVGVCEASVLVSGYAKPQPPA